MPGNGGSTVRSAAGTDGSGGAANASFDGSNVRFTFSIPRGEQGIQGATGQPGEVTNAALAAVIGGTSSNAVATLDTPMADPDAEALRQKINEFLNAARR